ncbi:DNA repair and recombination protein RAD54 and RAD54-like protein [Cladophialophora yegresii CBS 114405]|uniref:DNA repair and recombination protein RAD54 and RAD54-like protein n=1 Tax=Cladophialophora yegresii CBS 114405 TaxID=1182544 RepID=W9W541_9EURO|nr:DNA repair and recombination protein RAD54 and RAD54-like protein [Cladophialophora yegresii CBS 114405]EXJ60115.1 DNA repair and recombination protein RAD54 and RAD54-like protein [Cladophialophora yegresii CBS 114405]
MDPAVQRLLTDKLYDKRKQGALELERFIREASAAKEHDKIRKTIDQLCHDYAYAVHLPHARNGGLIGLAAAAIALGSDEVARYLSEIVPPVLACFTDQDARVRYYACEAMYNIAKVAKGEILVFFNDIFDALCKLAADSELSVKNGAELLDRLIKDIVSESAASYVSVLNFNDEGEPVEPDKDSTDLPTTFSLARFIPLLEERIHVLNPFTRTFLVSWLTLLDTIPDLELVHYLPAFLGGLFKFLGDPNRDVYVATQGLLERFLSEIKKIAKVKKDIAESRRSRAGKRRPASVADSTTAGGSQSNENAIDDSESGTALEEPNEPAESDGDWIPGQDAQVDHAQILDILLKFVDVSNKEEIGIVALRWIDSFFEISPEEILQFVPRLLSRVLPALSAQSEQVRTTASKVNRSLMDYILTFQDQDDVPRDDQSALAPSDLTRATTRDGEGSDKRQSGGTTKSPPSQAEGKSEISPESSAEQEPSPPEVTPRSTAAPSPQPMADLDYAAAVNALTLQFLNEHEETREAALTWLIMLHRKAPKKVLAFNDGTFPALLKTLSDPAEAVVTRDLQLLSQISKHSEDGYFTSFMVALLQLFSTDRKLLEIRGNLIIRQLCINLQPERIYRTLADCIEKDEDIEFASIMVQNLNNNLITAPELAELRKRLRSPDSREGQMFFVALFRAWCHNAVATFSLCLLAQAYEQAYNLLQIFADLEMTVNMLIQIDKLVQLLESPVFTYLRLQLLEPDRYPYLYKCLYGLLMLLPQSSAFGALKNRLNSVSAIGLLHTPASAPTPRPSVVGGMSASALPATTTGALNSTVSSRLRTRDAASATASDLKWPELLEKFKQTQERARRRNERLLRGDIDPETPASAPVENGGRTSRASLRSAGAGEGEVLRAGNRLQSGLGRSLAPGAGSTLMKAGSGLTVGGSSGGAGAAGPLAKTVAGADDRSGPHKRGHSLAGFGKFASGIARAGGSRDRDKKK